MSRSQVALFGIGGIIGATMLVSPLVNWTGGDTSPDLSNGYDPLLSEASCNESSSNLALTSRPAKEPMLQLASLDKGEIAFLEGIQPAGGNGNGIGTGGDGPGPGTGPLNEVLKDLDDQTQNGGDGGEGGIGGVGGGGGSGGGGGTPILASLAPKDSPPGQDPTDPLDPTQPAGPPGQTPPGPGECTVNCPPPEAKCTGPDCGQNPPIQTGCTGESCGTNPNPDQNPVVAVPEPASLGLLAFGIGLLAARRRRRV